MDRDDWNRRYADRELVWSAGPNRFLVEEASGLEPGTALDLAAGEGRNAIWLAGRGFRVTAVDFAGQGLAKGRRLAQQAGVEVEWVEADLLTWRSGARTWDLVLLFYLQLPWSQMRVVLRKAVGALAPGGTLLLVGHDRTNLEAGHGGPRSPDVLYEPDQVAAELSGLRVEKAIRVRREVATEHGPAVAIDCLVRARSTMSVRTREE